MSYATFFALLAVIMTMSATIVFTFANVFVQGDLYIFHGGSNLNEAPAPIAGAGLGIWVVAVGAYIVARKLRRKHATPKVVPLD